MLRQKRSRILFVLLIVLVATASWSGCLAHRQSILDRALIAAVTKDDVAATATLLAEGADPNAKDWHEQEAHGWLERVQHLLSGRSYKVNPAPALAIAMGRNNNAAIRTLKRHGADVDAARRYRLDGFMSIIGEEAITNSIRLLHERDQPAAANPSDQAKSWVGKNEQRRRNAFALGDEGTPSGSGGAAASAR